MNLAEQIDVNLVNCIVFDAHPIVCNSLKSLLETHPRVGYVCTTSDVVEAKRLLRTDQFGLLVLDVNAPILNGFDFIRQVKSSGYNHKVLFFSSSDDGCSHQAESIGADGYISKKETVSEVSELLDKVLNGKKCFKTRAKKSAPVVHTPKLTGRESTVLRHLLSGKSNNDISYLLSLSPKTVSTYKTRILGKYKVSSIVEIAKMASVAR